MKKYYLITILLISLLFFGCSTKTYTGSKTHFVDGTIMLDGVPLEGANIRFQPKDNIGETAIGKSVTAGNFKLSSVQGLPEQGAMAGTYIVIVSKTETSLLSKPNIDPVSGDPITQIAKELLPAIYQDPINTPLKVTIKEGENKIQLDLKSKP
ncbi:MAG: hypothetical protein LBI18_12200 [Planctomycetaceae bacterium]|jgi:hypothetical protein|nr:hypothetical protein [Planctomycetaceae bacterium]